MPDEVALRSKFGDVGKAAFWTATALNLVTLLLTSGINQQFLNEALQAAEGGTADASDFLSIFDVALSAFPLIAAIVITYFVIVELDFTYQSFGVIAVVWAVAGLLSVGFNWPLISDVYAQSTGHPLFRLLVTGLVLTVSPYSLLLLVQATVVAVAFLLSWAWLSAKWKTPSQDQA